MSPLRAIGVLLAMLVPAVAGAQGFHGIHSRDGHDVWAVGDGAVVYRSLDGGSSWARSTLGSVILRDVAAVDYRVIVVGDGGVVWRSQNNGGAWTSVSVPGSPSLRGLSMVSALTAYVAGSGGAIFSTADGGANWVAQVSGTGVRLNAIDFEGSSGWAVGEAGTVLHTVNGGGSWSPVAAGTTKELYGVDAAGDVVWVVGADGVARRSVNGGVNWDPIDLQIDSRADVRVALLEDENTVWLAGGGGFIRKSLDGGATWQFPPHPMHGQISAFAIAGGRAFACSNRHQVPIASGNGGANWSLPAGATLTRSWVRRLVYENVIRGNNLQLHPTDRNIMWCVLGNKIFRSPDGGDRWAEIATLAGGLFKANAFLVSPKDTNVFLAAVGQPRRIDKSVDYGRTWVTTLTQAFGEYGVPLEMHPDRPDTVYFGVDNSGLWRSTDFGDTWSVISSNVFRSPCDIAVIPGYPETIVLGDGVTSSLVPPNFFKSVNGGQDFDTTFSPSGPSEIPGLATSRLRPSTVFGSTWGSGGVHRSTDFGATWSNVTTTSSAWGIGIADDDPNCVIFGVFGGAQSYLSLDGGTTFTNISLSASNYGFLVRDRETFLAQQANGLYKMSFAYSYTPATTQALSVTAPNGGEAWVAGTVHPIVWISGNVAMARVEYRAAPGQWQTIAEVPAYDQRLDWTVPCVSSGQVRVRVVDAFDDAPEDSSGADFAILAPLIADAGPVDFAAVEEDSVSVLTLTISNQGASDLIVTGLGIAGSGPFAVARTSMTIPPFESDTVGVRFTPPVVGTYDDTLLVTSNACNAAVHRVALRGVGVPPGLMGKAFGVTQNRPNPFQGVTEIEYALSVAADVKLQVFDVQGHLVGDLVRERKGPGRYRVGFGPGASTASGERLGTIPSGVYFYRFRAAGYEATRKMLLLK